MEETPSPIVRACRLVGSQSKMAIILDVTPSMVSQMAKGDRPVPAEMCPTIERATSGAVRCEELRPDVDWGYLRATSAAPVEGATHA